MSIWGDFQGITGVTGGGRGVQKMQIWGDFQGLTGVTRGGRGVKKLENWGDVIYGWSLMEMNPESNLNPFDF